MAAEPARPEPVLRNGRGHDSERPVYRKKKKNLTIIPLLDKTSCYDLVYGVRIYLSGVNLCTYKVDLKKEKLEP